MPSARIPHVKSKAGTFIANSSAPLLLLVEEPVEEADAPPEAELPVRVPLADAEAVETIVGAGDATSNRYGYQN